LNPMGDCYVTVSR